MSSLISKELVEYWNMRASEFGYDIRTLAYRSKHTQERKFAVLSEILDKQECSVLDVGCGFGDLCLYLEAKGFRVRYHGVDIADKIVEIAKVERPRLRIEKLDILDLKAAEKYDYVLSTGFNCSKHKFNRELERAILRKMYELCRIGVAAGFLSTYSPFKKDGDVPNASYYSDPIEILQFAMSELTRNVTLIHDYLPHDFTIYIKKVVGYELHGS